MSGLAGRLWRRMIPESIRRPLYLMRRYGSVISRPGLSPSALHGLLGFYADQNPPVGIVERDGLSLEVDLRDYGVGVPLFLQEDYESAERRFLTRVLRPGDTVVDVGANLGYIAAQAAHCVGSSGRVLAFEPDPWNYELLERNRRNGLNQIQARQAALGDRAGEVALHSSATNFGDHRIAYGSSDRTVVKVPMLTGDEALRTVGEIRLLKLDVQGYEAFVLRGLDVTLRDRPPQFILMEYWPHGAQAAGADIDAAVKTVLSQGYALHRLDDSGDIAPTDLATIAAATPIRNGDPVASPFCNVVFVHATTALPPRVS